MTTYSTWAIDHLKTRGFRITRPRKRVLEVLEHTTGPLSPHEVHERLDAEGEHIDPVSVYRTLTCLAENGLVHRILTTGKFRRCDLEPEDRCEQVQDDHCHHNLLCRACGAIEELHCPGLDAVVAEVARISGFQIESHDLEFRGLCRNCR